jgi:REP element-mobilizing transposase RayT
VSDTWPLAYHITVGTYGTRLHGDDRGTVDRRMNRPGDPIIGHVEQWERMERAALRFPPRVFTPDQMRLVESLVPAVCDRGGWTVRARACAPDHLHVLVSGAADGSLIRKRMKRWLTQALAEHVPLEPEQTFWAECGSVKWVWTDEYLGRVDRYVHDQRATRDEL